MYEMRIGRALTRRAWRQRNVIWQIAGEPLQFLADDDEGCAKPVKCLSLARSHRRGLLQDRTWTSSQEVRRVVTGCFTVVAQQHVLWRGPQGRRSAGRCGAI